MIEEGDNYVSANTLAYLLFLLIILFWFPNKNLFGNIIEEGGNYVLANTLAYLIFLLINIPLIFLC